MSRTPGETFQPHAGLRPEATTGTYRRIWELAWPVSISTSTFTLLTLANLYWIGHLGTLAVAAVSLSSNVLFNVFAISHIVYIGALATAARRVGAGELAEAFNAGLHGICLGAVLGLAVAVVGWASAPPIIRFFDAGTDLETAAISYLRISLIGQIFLFVSVALSACYQAAGDTRTPMLVNVGVIILNGLLDPFFIFVPGQVVLGGVPLGWLGWGVNGAAIAALVSGIIGCAAFLLLWFVYGKPFPRPSQRRIAFTLTEFRRMLRIGTPASISLVARPLSTFLLLKVIASFGAAAIAAFGIALRSFSVNWIPFSGIGAAISTLVGQNLGRHDVAEATRVVRRGLVLNTALGVFFCIAYYAASEQIILAFDQEPDVVAAGVPYLKFMALGFLFSAPMFPLVSAMNGAGDTRPPMIAAFVANWPVKLPLCYVLAIPLAYGVDGVWGGMFVSVVLEAALVFIWYRRGSWKTHQL
ncbi:MAG: efflux family protein [Deltaproteobacteria bacterium]|nr:efflux family protein [Deltaproteobacteria bacterium]